MDGLQPPLFGGATYVPEWDEPRLNTQFGRYLTLMKDGQWRSLRQISRATGDPEASVNARHRDVNKCPICSKGLEKCPYPRKWRGESRRQGDPRRGLWVYRVVPAEMPWAPCQSWIGEIPDGDGA
jgi:hypothetical protein